MVRNTEINEWNNPLVDMSTAYWKNGFFTEHGGCFQVTLTPTELMAVVGYMMLGMNKVMDKTHEEVVVNDRIAL